MDKSTVIKRPSLVFVLHASLAAFGTYFCMYAFRKPFSVATFNDMAFWGVDYKILLVIAQVLGYALSKFVGIKVISELKPNRRLLYLISLIGIAEISLLLFAWTPAPYNILFMFLNGLPLGMIWGIVFSYIEGRRFTDILGVVLSASFIVSSGVVKSVGLFAMNSWGISEFWMPSVTGALFFIPLLICSFLLQRIPPPTPEDIASRTERIPMTAADRRDLVKKFFFPLVLIVLFYTFLTAFRDFRDNFARELWDSIGYQGDVSVFSTSEIIIAIIVLLIIGSIFYIKNNFKALLTYHALLILGTLVLAVGTLLFQIGVLDPFIWMVCTGFGLYICYVPFNCLFFDRFIASFRVKGNSGFLIYIADAFGYVGSVLVLLYKNFGQANLSWLNFFIYGTYAVAFIGIGSTLILYFHFTALSKAEQLNKQLDYGQ
ncbi:MAG: glucose-6-phosphate exchanger SLC37A4 [Algicola sp.]|nr:glucose-6-phosphate exchanger SLC37A4 [Algicola sp.]